MDLYNSFVEMLDDDRLPISNLNVLDLMHEVYAIEEQQSGTGTHFVSELRNDHQRSVILEAVVEYTRCRSLIEDGIPVSPRLDAGVERRDSGFIFRRQIRGGRDILTITTTDFINQTFLIQIELRKEHSSMVHMHAGYGDIFAAVYAYSRVLAAEFADEQLLFSLRFPLIYKMERREPTPKSYLLMTYERAPSSRLAKQYLQEKIDVNTSSRLPLPPPPPLPSVIIIDDVPAAPPQALLPIVKNCEYCKLKTATVRVFPCLHMSLCEECSRLLETPEDCEFRCFRCNKPIEAPASLKRKREEEQDRRNGIFSSELCIICEENKPNTIVRPCGHKVVCHICSMKLQNTSNAKLCIVCHAEIIQIDKL